MDNNMKYKVSELTGYRLNHAVALTANIKHWHYAKGQESAVGTLINEGSINEKPITYDPEHNWEQCGELIDKFNISLTFEEDGLWSATCYDENTNEGEDVGLGKTAQQAICRCVVASVYGDDFVVVEMSAMEVEL